MCLQFPHQVTALLTCSSVTWMLVCLVTFSTRIWNLFLVIKTTHPPVLLPIISSGSSGKNRVGTSFTHSPHGPTLGFPLQSLTTSIHRISIPLTSLYSLLTPSSNYTLPLLQCLHIKDSPPSTHVLSLFISGFTIKPVNLYCCFCFCTWVHFHALTSRALWQIWLLYRTPLYWEVSASVLVSEIKTLFVCY